MGKKKVKEKEDEALKARHELFCRFYTQNSETFGNATRSYAEAFDYKLDTLSREAVYEQDIDEETGETVQGQLIKESDYDLACNVCGVEGARLLRMPRIQERCRTLLNEYVTAHVVDSERAKVILQDRDLASKLRAIISFDKLHGRIIDKTQQVNRLPFGETDLSEVIAALPQERQDYFYEIIRSLIEEAELLRSAGTAQGGGAR